MKKLLLLLLILPCTLFAQNKKLPYELGKQQEIYFYGTGLTLWGSYLIGDHWKKSLDKEDINFLQRQNVNPIDRFACYNYNNTLNNIRETLEPITTGLTIGGVLTMAVMNDYEEDNFSKIMVMGNMYLEGLLLTTGIAKASKTYINRARPYTYNKDLSIAERVTSENYQSFISGNASLLFYNSVFIAKTYEDLFPNNKYSKWIWAGGLALSCTSAYMSVQSGKHFLTDVLAGAAVGSLVGYFIPVMHYRKNFKIEQIELFGSIQPQLYQNGFGARLAIGLN